MGLMQFIENDMREDYSLTETWEFVCRRKLLPYDPTLGDPDVPTGLSLLKARAWRRLGALYRQMDVDARYHWITAIGDLWPMDRTLPGGVEGSAAQVVVGGILTTLGWRARGGGMSHDVHRSQFERMHDYHEAAQRLLREAQTVDGLDVTNIGFSFSAAMGLEDIEEMRALRLRLNKAPQPSLLVDARVMLGLCEKWFGHQDTMWQFAQNRQSCGPEWLALIAYGHLEDHRFYTQFTQTADPQETVRWHTRTQSETFKRELEALQAKFLEKVQGPAKTVRDLWAQNIMGSAMASLHSWEAARPHLEAIGSRMIEQSWCYHMDCDHPMLYLNRVRRKAGLSPLFA